MKFLSTLLVFLAFTLGQNLFLAAQEPDSQAPDFSDEEGFDSLLVPVEIYDSVSFVDWPGTPLIYGDFIVDQEPVPINITDLNHCLFLKPLYLEAGISFTVAYRLLIDESGQIVRIIGIFGYNPLLKDWGGCVNQLMWEPATVDGEPISCWVSLPIRVKPLSD